MKNKNTANKNLQLVEQLALLAIQNLVKGNADLPHWVSPFGNPRIKACLPAPRGLSQTATSFVAFSSLGIHHTPLSYGFLRAYIYPTLILRLIKTPILLAELIDQRLQHSAQIGPQTLLEYAVIHISGKISAGFLGI